MSAVSILLGAILGVHLTATLMISGKLTDIVIRLDRLIEATEKARVERSDRR